MRQQPRRRPPARRCGGTGLHRRRRCSILCITMGALTQRDVWVYAHSADALSSGAPVDAKLARDFDFAILAPPTLLMLSWSRCSSVSAVPCPVTDRSFFPSMLTSIAHR